MVANLAAFDLSFCNGVWNWSCCNEVLQLHFLLFWNLSTIPIFLHSNYIKDFQVSQILFYLIINFTMYYSVSLAIVFFWTSWNVLTLKSKSFSYICLHLKQNSYHKLPKVSYPMQPKHSLFLWGQEAIKCGNFLWQWKMRTTLNYTKGGALQSFKRI